MKSYSRCSAGYQQLIEGEVHDFVRHYRSDPRLAVLGYDRVEGLRPQCVLELEVASGDRLLAHWIQGTLLLLDVGKHELTRQYSRRLLHQDLRHYGEAPERFWPDAAALRLFADHPDTTLVRYRNEMQPDWIHWLSEEQGDVSQDIVDEWGDLPKGCDQVHFIVGGPGTGKTAVLISLLKDFYELEEDVRIKVSPRLADYLRACLHSCALDSLGAQLLDERIPEILLIDDPTSHREIYWSIRQWAGAIRSRLLVLAFDPCQLEDSLSDRTFRSLVREHRVKVHELHSCYRQKKAVGKAAQNVFHLIAESSAFYRSDRVAKFRAAHQKLTSLSNSLTFVNPRGYTRSYVPNARRNELESELERVREYPQWQHWPGLLAVVDEEACMPRPWTSALRSAGAEIVDLSQVEMIKGLEYQHVFLFFGPVALTSISEIVLGQSRGGYFATRLLRIPLSRAKDSLVMFGVHPAVEP